MSEHMICVDCGSAAEFIEKEGIWRHKGHPAEDAYVGQTLCDRYGYPIRVRVQNDDATFRL